MADKNYLDYCDPCTGRTALMLLCVNSCYDNNLESIKALVKYGANVMIKDKQGDTAFLLLCKNIKCNNCTVQYLAEVVKNYTDKLEEIKEEIKEVEDKTKNIIMHLIDNGVNLEEIQKERPTNREIGKKMMEANGKYFESEYDKL